MRIAPARKPHRVARVFLICFFAFCLCGVAISLYGLHNRSTVADAAVVLGNEVLASGQPHPRLAARLDAALALFREKRCALIIVSGGTGKSGHVEADAMARYLEDRGVPPGKIVRDVTGVNTWETARFTAAYMREHNLASVVVVSQYFHSARSVMALRFMGIQKVGTASPRYFEWRDVYSVAREVPGIIWYFCKGLARAIL